MDVDNQNTSVPNEQTIPQESLTLPKDSEKTLTTENLTSDPNMIGINKTTSQPMNNNLPSQKPEDSSLVIPNKNSLDKVMYAGIVFMAVTILLALALYFK